MARLLVFLLIAFLATTMAVWVVDQSGDMRLFWRGYLVETSISVFFSAVICLVVSAVLIFQAVKFILTRPRALLKARRERAEARGYRALVRGMVAVAAGDIVSAKKESLRVNECRVPRPLRLLLSAQSAQLEGDESSAADSFHAMLSEPESEFLGLRGLMVQSLRNGEADKALQWARRAYEVNSSAEWVLRDLVELEALGENWQAAEKTVLAAARRKIIQPGQAQKRRAFILYQRAIVAVDADKGQDARRFVLKAVALRPGFIPAIKLAIELLLSSNRGRKARSLIKDSWKANPHPDLADLFTNILQPESSIARLKIIETLVEPHAHDLEALLLVAGSALDASLWGTARENLEKALKKKPDERAYRLMARLEREEKGDEVLARQWLLEATKAEDQPTWICNICNTPSEKWVANCLSCGNIDSLDWASKDRKIIVDNTLNRLAVDLAMGSSMSVKE